METTTPTSPAPQVGQVYLKHEDDPFEPEMSAVIRGIKTNTKGELWIQYSYQKDGNEVGVLSAHGESFLARYTLRSPAP